MKWNWGTKIALSFVGFVAFMSYLVISSFQQNIDLVTEDYYGAELKYGERIAEIKNAKDLEHEVQIELLGEEYVVTIPQTHITKGEAHFYRPNDQRFDRVLALKSGENKMIINKKELMPGKFRVKVSWETNGTRYYNEKVIFVK